jgi:hypothetical protein
VQYRATGHGVQCHEVWPKIHPVPHELKEMKSVEICNNIPPETIFNKKITFGVTLLLLPSQHYGNRTINVLPYNNEAPTSQKSKR